MRTLKVKPGDRSSSDFSEELQLIQKSPIRIQKTRMGSHSMDRYEKDPEMCYSGAFAALHEANESK